MSKLLRVVDRMGARSRTRSFKRRIILFVALIMILAMIVIIPNVTPQPPTVSGPDNIKVKGNDKLFSVTVKVTSNENSTYRVEINDIENVTNRFVLINNGISENKTLAPGASFNFTLQLKTRTASLGQKSVVPYNVFQNDVLVTNGQFTVNVEAPKITNPSDINCNTCGLVIPPLIIGGLYIVTSGKWKKVRNE